MQRFPITRAGYDRLSGELQQLKKIERPKVIEAIATAREHGDLSENADYSAAREKQGFIEGRIAELEQKLARADVTDNPKINTDKIQFGAHVVVLDDKGKELSYQLVGELEADISKGSLSIISPIGKALLGRKVGDYIEVNTPSGQKEYKIQDLKYI